MVKIPEKIQQWETRFNNYIREKAEHPPFHIRKALGYTLIVIGVLAAMSLLITATVLAVAVLPHPFIVALVGFAGALLIGGIFVGIGELILRFGHKGAKA